MSQQIGTLGQIKTWSFHPYNKSTIVIGSDTMPAESKEERLNCHACLYKSPFQRSDFLPESFSIKKILRVHFGWIAEYVNTLPVMYWAELSFEGFVDPPVYK